MSDSTATDGSKKADGQNQDPADGSDKSKQQVSYDTYDKAMGSLKKEKDRVKDLEAQLAKINEDKLMSEGKKDELIESLRAKNDAFEQTIKKEKAERILDRFKADVVKTATKKGFKNPGLAQKMFSIADFSIDEKGTVDMAQLESKFDELKSTDSFLFGQSDKKIADGTPKYKVADGSLPSRDALKDMKGDELMSLLKQMENG